MSRLDKAREAYLKRDIVSLKKIHHQAIIHSSLHHHEAHRRSFNLPEIILGGQDGLVNVLGVILGVAAATFSNQIVIVAGIAAAFAESISMGAVAYTAKIAEVDYYQSELERESYEIEHFPNGEKEEVRALYENYGFEGKLLDTVVNKITANKTAWLKVMMEQELKLEPVERQEAIPSAIIVGLSAIVGSFIPLLPFFFLPIKPAILISLLISSVSLFVVGYYKAQKTLGRNFLKQGLEMMIIGMLSALVGYFIGALFKIK
ncbi:VIT1/CCC1 transporter family protein [Candidatus Roizmanbacteria bacterium]|nr:VIT1/CCC1 transporter family protein [Candidatus Roizmanbacteria bacterium]